MLHRCDRVSSDSWGLYGSSSFSDCLVTFDNFRYGASGLALHTKPLRYDTCCWHGSYAALCCTSASCCHSLLFFHCVGPGLLGLR